MAPRSRNTDVDDLAPVVDDIPPTEPKAPEVAPVAAAAAAPRGRVIPGADLRAQVEPPPPERLRWYWVGALPECPYENVHVAGICFAKETETVIRSNESEDGRTVRYPQRGSPIALSRRHLLALSERLRTKSFRFLGPQANGKRGASLMTRIPEAELEEVRKAGLVRMQYVPAAGDRPLAEFIYCVPIPGNEMRKFGPEVPLPQPLSVTGLELPPHDDEAPLEAAG